MFKQLLLKEFRYNYPSWFSWFSMILNEMVILSVFWYTAKAFIPSLELFNNQEVNYFSFIVIGLSVIRVPTFLITAFVRKIREARIEGVLESLQLLPRPITNTLIIWGLISTLTEVVRVIITICLALAIFGLSLNAKSLITITSIQLTVIPLFTGLGLMAAAIYLRFGRGDALVAKLASLGGILSGAYFPITVLPQKAAILIGTISPFNLMISLSRSSQIDSISILILILEGFFFLALGYFLLQWSFKSFKRRCPPFHVS